MVWEDLISRRRLFQSLGEADTKVLSLWTLVWVLASPTAVGQRTLRLWLGWGNGV